MGDCPAERSGLRLVKVDVDPLVVVSGISKLVDPLLVDCHPVGDSDFLSDEFHEILGYLHVAIVPFPLNR